MAEKAKRDALKYTGNLIGLALILHILLAILMRLLAGALVGAVFKGATLERPAGVPEWVLGIYNILLPLVTLLPVYILLRKGGRPVKLEIPVGKGKLPLAIILPLFLGFMIVVNAISSLLYGALAKGVALPAGTVYALPQTGLGLFLYFIAACVLPPFLEEQVFRGAIQNLLRPWGPRFSILVTSILFTLLHTDVEKIVAIFLMGLLLGWVCEVGRSVVPCILLHFANNTISFVLALSQRGVKGETALAMTFWVMLVFMGLFLGALYAAWRVRLGRRFRLPKDPPMPKGRPGRLRRLSKAAFLLAALVCLLGYSALRIFLF